MSKIVLIGAGSMKFTATLVNDILSTPVLRDSHFALVDINPERLELARKLVQALIDHRGTAAQVETTTDRRTVLAGADYVVITILVGGIEAYKFDIEIPMKYGVGQCVGDTLGPGGIFRGLRTIPVLLDICQDISELCPDALLINYSNPMAILCMAIAKGSKVRHVGLCHSVQGTAEMLAGWLRASYNEVSYWVAGINHQAWFLEFLWNGKDAYPLLRERIQDPEIIGQEPVRTELMKHFGYFVTESSGHASEYLPYFRKNEAQIEELVKRFTSPADFWFDWGRTGGCLRYDQKMLDEFTEKIRTQTNLSELLPTKRSLEYCSYIMEAIETNRPVVINGNVPNQNLITNLPEGCCVEVPCLVDGNGIHPCFVGELPEQLAALNRTNINVQLLAVQGALNGDREAIYHATMMDPLTAAVCTLPQIRAMTDELFEAEASWLPQFK
ncbi:MAG: alpha-glucosidase/alpha-galactosidase [Anaerolineae bacterium]